MTAERHRVAVPGGHVSLVLHLPDVVSPVACVVACHGLSASKESDKYLLLASEVPAAGLALARFDFRGCGESSGVEDETTVQTRLEDVDAVLTRLGHHARLSGRVGFVGSSMGGFVALHAAHARADDSPVVTWNAPADLSGVANADSHDGRGLGPAFFTELAGHRYDTTPAGVGRHLVIQGEADDVVTVEHGSVLYARAADPCDFVIIAGADHRLTDPGHRRQAVEATLAWMQRFLKE